jgi:NADPH:quinone reductase-like Zn-dependent oxidoreductase
MTAEETLCRQGKGYQILGEQLNGTHAELVKVPAANIFAKPPSLSFDEAAAIPLVFTTAWQMLVRRAHVKPGDLVLIHASGSGVSTAAIQIAAVHGAEIIATSTSEEKLQRAKELGAHHIIHTPSQDFPSEVKRIARGGADIIIDHVGQAFWEKNIRAVRWGGAIVMCGATSGFEAKVDLRQIFFRQIQVLGSTMGSKGDFATIVKLAGQGRLRGVVDRMFPLTRIADAHRWLETGEQFGKVVLEPKNGRAKGVDLSRDL